VCATDLAKTKNTLRYAASLKTACENEKTLVVVDKHWQNHDSESLEWLNGKKGVGKSEAAKIHELGYFSKVVQYMLLRTACFWQKNWCASQERLRTATEICERVSGVFTHQITRSQRFRKSSRSLQVQNSVTRFHWAIHETVSAWWSSVRSVSMFSRLFISGTLYQSLDINCGFTTWFICWLIRTWAPSLLSIAQPEKIHDL